jgi:CBS-domain-containing membrane protein
MRVEQLMTRTVKTCAPQDTLDRAAGLMWDYDCGALPVIAGDGAGDRVVGVLTDRDICMAAYTQGRALRDIPVASAMAQRVCSCRPSDTVAVALRVIETNQIRRVPVVDDGDHLVGMLSLADLWREARREHGQRSPDVTERAIGEAVEAIAAPRARGSLVPFTTAAG